MIIAILAGFLTYLVLLPTPKVWIQESSGNSGVIAYQNYDPATDNMARINKLIPCPNYKKVWNGHKSMSTGAPTYAYSKYASGMAIMTPIDSGVIQWTEYHYECVGDYNENQSTFSTTNESEEAVDCMYSEYCRNNHGGVDFKACLKRLCD